MENHSVNGHCSKITKNLHDPLQCALLEAVHEATACLKCSGTTSSECHSVCYAALDATWLSNAIQGVGSYLSSFVWHRACIHERPLVSNCFYLTSHSSRMAVLLVPSIKSCHLVGLRNCTFSVVALMLWNSNPVHQR